MSSCPNCRQSVAPADDICENCGAVLSTLIPTPAFVAASPSVASATTSSSSSTIGAGLAQSVVSKAPTPSACPNCSHPLHPGEDICEQCGMVIPGVAAPSQ